MKIIYFKYFFLASCGQQDDTLHNPKNHDNGEEEINEIFNQITNDTNLEASTEEDCYNETENSLNNSKYKL